MMLVLVLMVQAFAQKAPQRVEPPFWWAGMHHREVQVLVYGENIGQTRVKIDHPGVTLTEVVAVESPNYLFLYLDIAEAQAGTVKIDFVSGRRTLYSYNFELRQRKEHARYHQGFDASDAIYLLMPDRFANGNPANDDMPGMLEKADRSKPSGRHGGDIAGILQNLDHIQNMGFSSIWINPLLENNQPRYSYHGYAVTDFYTIDARFGGNQEYVELIKAADARGMKIIKDMIFNHCGHHHWWMKDLPARDWLNQWPEFTRTSYRMTTIVDPHAAKADYQRMMNGWFDTNMPDLNQQNRLLALYLIQNSVWWIEYAGIHGIRMDTQPYADLGFMSDWGKYVMTEYPNFNIVGESWLGLPAMISYFQGGKKNHDGYDSHIPSVFDFSLYDAIGEAFTEQPGWASGLMRIYNSLTQDFLYADPFNLVIFGDNHDTDRILHRVGDNLENLKMALTLIFTTRGIPSVYTGTELLKSAKEHDGHGELRADFPGGWAGDPVNAFTAAGRTPEQNEIVNLITQLLQFRNQNPVMHYGRLKQFVPENNVYVYFRYDDQKTVMVILSANDQPVELDMRRFREATHGFAGARNILNGESTTGFGLWTLPAKAALVLELQ